MSELIKTPKDRIPKAWIELSRERELPSSVLRFIVRVGKATAGKDIAIDKDNLHEAKVALEFLNDCERSEARIKRIKAAVGIPAFSTKDPLRHEAICECVQSGALVRREWIGGTHTYFYVRAKARQRMTAASSAKIALTLWKTGSTTMCYAEGRGQTSKPSQRTPATLSGNDETIQNVGDCDS